MYFLFGARANLETVVALARPYAVSANLSSLCHLKAAYQNYLSTIQPAFASFRTSSGPEFVRDVGQVGRLLALFQEKSRLNDIQQDSVMRVAPISDEELDWVGTSALSAIRKIAELDGDLGSLMNLVVNQLFTAGSQRAGGGSSSVAIGCIWMNPRRRWTEQDFCEFLIHETSHQMMFLDELRYRHYQNPDSLERAENFAFSTILNRPRPLDKVIHSLIVAHEVLAFRKRFFDPTAHTSLHPATNVLEQSIGKTVGSLRSLDRNLMTDRAWNIVDLIGEADERSRIAV